MGTNSGRVVLGVLVWCASARGGEWQPERLDRGVVAVSRGDGRVLVSWRLLGSDAGGVGFEVRGVNQDGSRERLNEEPVRGATCLVVEGGFEGYEVGVVDSGQVANLTAATKTGQDGYLSIPLRTLPGHTPNDASVGDLDGDGRYEVVLKQEMRPRDNSQRGETGQTKLEAYTLDGRMLWRIDLGPNIREGAHYTPFLVYDLDGDGKAEVACRTADGTVDGQGRVIGEEGADHRNGAGYVLKGPEFLTVFEGATGRELASVDYVPARGEVTAWGDDYGNRADRFLACVAYLDGVRPSLVMCRGYYTRTVLAAWDWRDGKLASRWVFDSEDGTPGNEKYSGQGNHGLAVADVDGDGKDEVVYGACCIDDNGKGLYSTGLGHGDALHVSDMDPLRPGLEVFAIHERPRHSNGINLREASTGEVLWGKPSPDVGRGLAMDIDPRWPGAECWASGRGLEGLYNCRGERVSGAKPRSCNMGAWWDGDLLRELVDGTSISKWDWEGERTVPLLSVREAGCASNNGTKANPCLVADILGDWREEVMWRTRDGKELRIYATGIETDVRLPTLMHDRTYRLGVAWQNVGYNQPAHVGTLLQERR